MIEGVEEEISEVVAEKNAEKIKEHFKGLSNMEGKFNSLKMWKLKKTVMPRSYDPPMAKKHEKGNLATTTTKLKKLYRDTYIARLSQNAIKPEFKMLHQWKDQLCHQRLEYAKLNKTKLWTPDDILKVLKKLKNNKTSDAMNIVNELVKPDVAGKDLTQSLIAMMNQVKIKLSVPDQMKKELVYSIYKNKGKKDDLNNDRGIFILQVIRSIIDKLIYEDEYETVD